MSYGEDLVNHNLSLLRSGKMGSSFSFEEHYALEQAGQQAPSYAELQAQDKAAVEKEVSNNEQDFANRYVQPQIKEYLENGAPEMLFAYPLVPPQVKEVAQAAKQVVQTGPDCAEMQRLEANRSVDLAKLVSFKPYVVQLVQETEETESAAVPEEQRETAQDNRYVAAVQEYKCPFKAVEEKKRTDPVTGEFTKNHGWGQSFGSEKSGDHFHVTVPNPPSARDVVTKSSEIRERWGKVHGTWDANRRNPERVFGPESGSLEGRVEVDALKKEGQLERRVRVMSWREI